MELEPKPEQQPQETKLLPASILLLRVVLTVVLLLAATAATYWYYNSADTAKNVSETKPPRRQTAYWLDPCVREQSALVALIDHFEKFQMERNAKEVLALFTPANHDEEMQIFAHLTGSDSTPEGRPFLYRLYSTGQTNFNQSAYTIVFYPKENMPGMCVATIFEQRSYYPQGVGGSFGPMELYTLQFFMKRQGDAWMIDRYSSSAENAGKYSGWGY